MRKIFLILSVALLALTACTSSDDNPVKPQPEPRTVLVGLEFRNKYPVGPSMEVYTYDADYRLVNMKEIEVGTGDVLADLDYIYTPGHITKKGWDLFYDITDECTLDDQGRIVEYHHKNVKIETGQLLSDYLYTYTYDENGHMATTHSGDYVETYIWEGDELRTMTMAEGNAYTTYDFEPSDAPAQALFNRFGYNLPELCLQGRFGVLPAHMPAKVTSAAYIDGTMLFTSVTEFTTTTADDGHLGTVSKGNTTFVLHWGQQ